MGEPSESEAPQPDANRISPKEAVEAARSHFEEVTGERTEVVVEELELAEGGRYWMVTLGYREKFGPRAYSLTEQKSYKLFKVDAYSGFVISMKVREL